jgi:hypothetical protein
MTEVVTYNEQLAEANFPSLAAAIGRVDADFPGGVDLRLRPSGSYFYTARAIEVGDAKVAACAPCAVLNALLALGIEPKQNVATITKRLYAGNTSSIRGGEIPFLVSDDEFEAGTLFANSTGINQLLRLARSPLGADPLDFYSEEVWDMGTAHEALAHGQSVVFVHNTWRHCITVIGLVQAGDSVRWELVPPDSVVGMAVARIGEEGTGMLVGARRLVTSFLVDPRALVYDFSLPAWIIGRPENSWRPKEMEGKRGEDLGVILPE